MIVNYPILLCSDSHTKCENLDAVKAKHPEITTRFFLGDLFSFIDQTTWTLTNKVLEGNILTCKWLKVNINDWHFLLGNHDLVACREGWKYNVDKETYNLVAGKFVLKFEIEVNGVKYLLVHSKPRSLWDFINVGEYSYRDLCEDFPNHENYKAIIGGHTHKAAKHNFMDTDVEIWQLGALRDGHYGILTEKGLEYKKL